MVQSDEVSLWEAPTNKSRSVARHLFPSSLLSLQMMGKKWNAQKRGRVQTFAAFFVGGSIIFVTLRN